jgi:predicted aldo/keto reductase-like oxidoreductase
MVGTDCQDNLLQILKTAVIDYGINHIETARGYGCSELQLGCALKQLYLTNQIKREDLIIQSKIPPNKDIAAFETAIETSLKNLQTDYLDLFAFHGMNFSEQLEWVFGRGNNNTTEDCKNCMDVILKYQKMGKIKYIGFSTHGSTDLILECINKDCFDYVNLHYHYFGSYTATGGGHDGGGTLDWHLCDFTL